MSLYIPENIFEEIWGRNSKFHLLTHFSYSPVRYLKKEIALQYHNGFLIGIFVSIVKVQVQESKRNTVKQASENGKKSWVRTSHAPGVKNMRLRNGLELHWAHQGLYSRSPTNWFQLIMNISNRSRDRERRRGGTTDVTNARMCHFFAICLTVFIFKFLPRTFSIGVDGKHLSDQSLTFWSVFFLQTAHSKCLPSRVCRLTLSPNFSNAQFNWGGCKTCQHAFWKTEVSVFLKSCGVVDHRESSKLGYRKIIYGNVQTSVLASNDYNIYLSNYWAYYRYHDKHTITKVSSMRIWIEKPEREIFSIPIVFAQTEGIRSCGLSCRFWHVASLPKSLPRSIAYGCFRFPLKQRSALG